VAVIGGGPAGLMAAIAAAERGRTVVLLEQLDRPGVKLLATGGGRCNLTNTLPPDEFMGRFGRHGRFMQPALAAMDSRGLRQFFDALGVPTHAPDGVHVYPVSEKALTVQQALRRRSAQLGVAVCLGVRVTGLWMDAPRVPGESPPSRVACPARRSLGMAPPAGETCPRNSGVGMPPSPQNLGKPLRIVHHSLRGVETAGGRVAAPRVVIATGGRSYPELGATGTGYDLARQAGHTMVEPTPALVPLVTRETWPGECAGVAVSPARVWIDLAKQPRAGVTGDILFTHTGLSGPAVLDLSGDVAALLPTRGSVPLRIDLAPGTTVAEWSARFDRWQAVGGEKTARALLDRYLPRSLAAAVCAAAGIHPLARPAGITRPQRRTLAEHLAALPLTVTGTEGWASAMVTRGGVGLKEVDPRTLESRRVAGIFFAGEILDLDGPSGGFNLQWAFSSGHLAGAASAECGVST